MPIMKSRTSRMISFSIFAAVLLLVGCESVPDPVIPPQEKAESPGEAEAQYLEYRLSKVGHTFWGAHYLQGTKPYRYNHQRLSHLYALSSPQARSAYREGTNLMIVRSVLGAAGGGSFGYPLGWYYAYGEFRPADYVFLGVGLVSAGVSIFLSFLADDAFEEAISAYNLDLRRTLGAEE
jgi:hypothetical protein